MDDRIFPKSLEKGDTVAVIAPSRGYSLINQKRLKEAEEFLSSLGLHTVFLGQGRTEDFLQTQNLSERIEDIHEAFTNTSYKGIFSLIGGYDAIRLLDKIDFSLIAKNPKVFCGYSDITTLSLAIYKKTGLVSYSGPHFSSWSCIKALDYMQRSFLSCCFSKEPYAITPSKEWFDDEWFKKESASIEVNQNSGPRVIAQGRASGRLVGGHLRAINSLQGTEYFPDLEGAILFLEDDEEVSPEIFYRNLSSLALQPGFHQIKGLMVGRFQVRSKMGQDILKEILKSLAPSNIPIVAEMDFGHTMPICTLPIGGEAELNAASKDVFLGISLH